MLGAFVVWALHFAAIQAVLAFGCGRLGAGALRTLLALAGVGAVAWLLALPRERAGAALAIWMSLAGVLLTTLALPALPPCVATR